MGNTQQSESRNVDELFMDYLKAHSVDKNFRRIARGIYSYEQIKMSVCMKGPSLICRVGCDFMRIEQFLKKYVGVTEAGHRKAQSTPWLSSRGSSRGNNSTGSPNVRRASENHQRKDIGTMSLRKIGSYQPALKMNYLKLK